MFYFLRQLTATTTSHTTTASVAMNSIMIMIIIVIIISASSSSSRRWSFCGRFCFFFFFGSYFPIRSQMARDFMFDLGRTLSSKDLLIMAIVGCCGYHNRDGRKCCRTTCHSYFTISKFVVVVVLLLFFLLVTNE